MIRACKERVDFIDQLRRKLAPLQQELSQVEDELSTLKKKKKLKKLSEKEERINQIKKDIASLPPVLHNKFRCNCFQWPYYSTVNSPNQYEGLLKGLARCAINVVQDEKQKLSNRIEELVNEFDMNMLLTSCRPNKT